MTHRALDDNTPLRIEAAGEKPRMTTWREFFRDNIDGDLDMLDVQDRLALSGRATVGGGAAAAFVIIVDQPRFRDQHDDGAPETPELV